MASPQESEILTRVGPGTPMGNLMRQYWIPAAMSSELTADGPPLRLMLLGERLLAFRDSSGRVGVMDHRCPHRCASLFFGRNEDNGLRCVYHGWKFDTEGRCVDMPNVPPEHDYKDKVRARAYPAVERSGLVWVYMGPRNPAPGLPMFEAALLEGEDLQITFSQRECNYLQALEGDIDTTHLGFLHLGALNPEDLKRDHNNLFPIANRHPDLRVKRTAWGTMYGARRLVEDKIYWRFAHFLLPFWTMIPNGTFGEHIGVRAWVPMDDTHVMFVFLRWNGYRVHNRMLRDGGRAAGIGGRRTFLPNSSDWYGRFRSIANAANDYLIDREVQRTRSYTGIEGVPVQDQAVTESMGAITDHGFEHLGHSDVMIIQTRRRLLEVLAAMSQGHAPPGVDNPRVYLGARGGDFALEHETDWLEAYAEQMRTSANPTGQLQIPQSGAVVGEPPAAG